MRAKVSLLNLCRAQPVSTTSKRQPVRAKVSPSLLYFHLLLDPSNPPSEKHPKKTKTKPNNNQSKTKMQKIKTYGYFAKNLQKTTPKKTRKKHTKNAHKNAKRAAVTPLVIGLYTGICNNFKNQTKTKTKPNPNLIRARGECECKCKCSKIIINNFIKTQLPAHTRARSPIFFDFKNYSFP